MTSPATAFPVATVRELARLLQDANLGEIALETTGDEAGQRLVVRRASFVAAPVSSVPEVHGETLSTAETTPNLTSETGVADKNIVVTATAVGVFRTPKPPVSDVGAQVKKKTVLGVVQSLNVANEIYAPQDGKIVEILVSDGQGVEWGQPLVVLEPSV